MSMDLMIIDNIQKFSWNFEEIKQYLENYIKQYENLVVSETNLQDMERTQREIASLRTKISKFKTTVKRELEKPYLDFEVQVKELLKLVEYAELPIQEQIEKYEQKRREEKSIEVQHWINEIATELGLEEKYVKQIAVTDKYLNRTQKPKDTKEDIQMKVCWFLDVQAKEREAEKFRQEKIEMVKFLCQSLSAGLVTPVTFEEIEYKIDSTDIASLKLYIENEVAKRKEREERAAKQAIERVEEEKLVQDQLKSIGIITTSVTIEDVAVQPEQTIRQVPEDKIYNSKFVIYGLTLDEHIMVEQFLRTNKLEFQSVMKETEKAG